MIGRPASPVLGPAEATMAKQRPRAHCGPRMRFLFCDRRRLNLRADLQVAPPAPLLFYIVVRANGVVPGPDGHVVCLLGTPLGGRVGTAPWAGAQLTGEVENGGGRKKNGEGGKRGGNWFSQITVGSRFSARPGRVSTGTTPRWTHIVEANRNRLICPGHTQPHDEANREPEGQPLFGRPHLRQVG